MQTVKPGQIVPHSGAWVIVGPRGGIGKERTLIKGETAPPTLTAGSYFKLVRAARNGAGRG